MSAWFSYTFMLIHIYAYLESDRIKYAIRLPAKHIPARKRGSAIC